jgi:hypothetical protein
MAESDRIIRHEILRVRSSQSYEHVAVSSYYVVELLCNKGEFVALTKAEETYSAIETLLKRGTRLSDAFREVVRETGRSEAAVRASYYNQRAKLGFKGSPRRDSRGFSPESAVEEAKRVLERAIERIDREVEAAKVRMEAAEAQYETLKVSAEERRAELERKLAAL